MNNAPEKKSYVHYTSLFNKVGASPLMIVLAALTSAFFVYSVIDLAGSFGDFPESIPGLILPGIALICSFFSALAMWLIFFGARKQNISPSPSAWLPFCPSAFASLC